MTRRNLLAVARSALFNADTGEPVDMSAAKPNTKFFVVTDEMRQPVPAKDIVATFAQAVKENTAMLTPEETLAGRLKSQTDAYADHVRAEIERIKGEQSTADTVHTDYLKRLDDEKAEAVRIHFDLTAANNERIADAERTLKGIEALNHAIDPARDTDISAEAIPFNPELDKLSRRSVARLAARGITPPDTTPKPAEPSISSNGGAIVPDRKLTVADADPEAVAALNRGD